ncbi:MAG: ubiquinol-cytochrome C chaperone family protein [Rhizomicrobium sp.]
MLNALRRNSEKARLVRALYGVLTAQARQPVFFKDFGVADSIDGRFDMVALHAWLVFGRLRACGMGDVAHGLSDALFVGFDEALRDLGAGDMGMGRKIKQMGDAFNGRMQAYSAASGEAALADAIHRNVYRGEANRKDESLALARYALTARACLDACDPRLGILNFGPLPKRRT